MLARWSDAFSEWAGERGRDVTTNHALLTKKYLFHVKYNINTVKIPEPIMCDVI
jgi:hypothetical protein